METRFQGNSSSMRLMGWYAGEQVAQVGFGVDVVQFRGTDQAVDCGGAFATGVGTGEQVVLAA